MFEAKVPTGPCPSEALGGLLPASGQLPVLGISGHAAASAQSLPPLLHGLLPSVSVFASCPPGRRTPVMLA